jgi:hypothetical protein
MQIFENLHNGTVLNGINQESIRIICPYLYLSSTDMQRAVLVNASNFCQDAR